LYSGNVYRALKSDIGTSTVGIFYEKKTGVLYVLASSLPALNCPGGYWTDSTYIYVYTSNGAAPSDSVHGLEIVFDTGTAHFITNSGANGDVFISNITIKGVVYMTYAVFLGSGENIDLFLHHVVFDKMKSGAVLIYELGSSWSGTLEFDNVILSPTYTVNYGGLTPALINLVLGTNTAPKHYVFKDVRVGPVGGIGALEMSNAESTALFENVILYGNRNFAHAGIQVHSDPAYGTGSVDVKNSIFAGYDYGSGTEPLLCAAGPGTVSDFAYSPVNQRVKINIENTLFAYPYVGLQFNPPVAGSILTGKNNIFINGPPNLIANFDIQSWDYNLYYGNNDPYSNTEIANVFGTRCHDINCIKTAWDNSGYPNNDEHSLNVYPLFVDGDADLGFNYDFTPADGSPLCGAGEGGADIGPIPCGGSSQQCSGTPTSCGIYPDCVNCNLQDGCSGTSYRDYYCSGTSCAYTTDSCTDCSCTCGGYNVPESSANNNCNDGINNDCDACTDGEEASCGGTETGSCTGGVDDDCDGLTDCADSVDCGSDPACTGAGFNVYYECEDADVINNPPFLIGSIASPPPSGGEYIYAPSGLPVNPTPVANAVIYFTTPITGDYYLWLRTYGPDGSSDASYIGFDTSYDRVYPSQFVNYEWVRVEVVNGGGDYSHYLTAGSHQVNMNYGEPLARLDRIFITNDPAAVPSDTGCTDNDFDDYGNPASSSCMYPELDCNDNNPNINPGEIDICSNGIDEDCSGADLTCAVCSNGAVPEYGCTCGGTNYYTGYCCDGSWQPAGPCSGECPERPLEGFGASTLGGEGKPLYHVTSLADSGAGTLRDALSQGNRYVVFDVAGAINLASDLVVTNSYITIDGTTAPSPGITLKSSGASNLLLLRDSTCHDIIVKNIRLENAPNDNIQIRSNAYNIVIDHCSARGAGDGNVDIGYGGGNHDITVQWTLIGEGGKNSLMSTDIDGLSLHNNFYNHGRERNPQISAEPSVGQYINFDMVNNVVFDWGDSSTGYGTRIRQAATGNVVNNYYLAGLYEHSNAILIEADAGLVYMNGNILPPECSTTGNTGTPIPADPVTTTSPYQAFVDVYNEVGACPRDSSDQAHVEATLDYLPACTISSQISNEVCICDGAPYYNGYCCAGYSCNSTCQCNTSLYCGDGFCSNGETCSSCPGDCGECDDDDDDGNRRRRGGSLPPPPCVENWTCTNWFPCFNGIRERICTDSNNCSTNESKPSTREDCAVGGQVNVSFNQSVNITSNVSASNQTVPAGGEAPFMFPLPNFIAGSVLAIILLVVGQLFAYRSFKRRKLLEPHSEELDSYIEKVLIAGRKPEDAIKALVNSGWPKDIVEDRMKKLQKKLRK
jgi:pectate lyase